MLQPVSNDIIDENLHIFISWKNDELIFEKQKLTIFLKEEIKKHTNVLIEFYLYNHFSNRYALKWMKKMQKNMKIK